MIYCNCCGQTSDASIQGSSEEREFWGEKCREPLSVCPLCGSDDIEDAKECGNCGRVLFAGIITDGLCPKCAVDTARAVKAFLDTLSIAQKNYICEANLWP